MDYRVASPADAIARLLEGNRRVVGGHPRAPHRSAARLHEVAHAQHPFAAILGCADSRVPVELVFDQGLGDLFVARIAGNVADAGVVGSLEFAVLRLGVRVVMVLGHTRCGAVAAALRDEAVPGRIGAITRQLRPAVRGAHGDAEAAMRRNVARQVRRLRASPVLGPAHRDGRAAVVGAVYDLDAGAVALLDD